MNEEMRNGKTEQETEKEKTKRMIIFTDEDPYTERDFTNTLEHPDEDDESE